MRVLLVSTYELGHQPLHLASPAAALREAGHAVRCVDLSVQRWDPATLGWAQALAFSVPMHTAMRLAIRAADQVQAQRPDLPICFYGLYATEGADPSAGWSRRWAIAGEYEPALVAWLNGVAAGSNKSSPPVQLGRTTFRVPARDLLPPLEQYAHLALDGDHQRVGYVEASHGCVHTCRHCPVPVVYDGRIRVVDEAVVLADIAQHVALGARHITFGDPDFLNGWKHSLRIVRSMHERFPNLTFDCTTKVEHILERAQIWPEMAALGCLFVVSAFESVNDQILARLDKGHTTAEASNAVAVLREHGIEIRPSWLPFTPWTQVDDVLDILDFVATHQMIGNVDPVQYSIRLLVPKGSLLLRQPEIKPYLGTYDADKLAYAWTPADPRTDALQRRIAALVETHSADGVPSAETYLAVRELATSASGREPRDAASTDAILAGATEARPRLTEPWFC